MEKINEQSEGVHDLFHAREEHGFNNNLCFKHVKPFSYPQS